MKPCETNLPSENREKREEKVTDRGREGKIEG